VVLVHKTGNVLNALPKSAHPGAKKALAVIWSAEDKDHAQAAAKVFATDYGIKWPKPAAKITDDVDVLLALYDYPAEHWIHLRTTNPIESTFATVKLRQRVTKAPAPAPPIPPSLDVCRYRHMIAPWHEQRRRRTSSTLSPSSSAGRSWCCCGRVRCR
jgi:hypothetical protein